MGGQPGLVGHHHELGAVADAQLDLLAVVLISAIPVAGGWLEALLVLLEP